MGNANPTLHWFLASGGKLAGRLGEDLLYTMYCCERDDIGRLDLLQAWLADGVTREELVDEGMTRDEWTASMRWGIELFESWPNEMLRAGVLCAVSPDSAVVHEAHYVVEGLHRAA